MERSIELPSDSENKVVGCIVLETKREAVRLTVEMGWLKGSSLKVQKPVDNEWPGPTYIPACAGSLSWTSTPARAKREGLAVDRYLGTLMILKYLGTSVLRYMYTFPHLYSVLRLDSARKYGCTSTGVAI